MWPARCLRTWALIPIASSDASSNAVLYLNRPSLLRSRNCCQASSQRIEKKISSGSDRYGLLGKPFILRSGPRRSTRSGWSYRRLLSAFVGSTCLIFFSNSGSMFVYPPPAFSLRLCASTSFSISCGFLQPSHVLLLGRSEIAGFRSHVIVRQLRHKSTLSRRLAATQRMHYAQTLVESAIVG